MSDSKNKKQKKRIIDLRRFFQNESVKSEENRIYTGLPGDYPANGRSGDDMPDDEDFQD